MEWITNNRENLLWKEITSKWENFSKYITYKFGNYELKYTPPVFIDKLYAITSAFSLELNAMEVPQDLSLDNIGTTIKGTSKSTNTYTGQDAQSYAGYNVEGDFQKNKNENTTDNEMSNDKYIVNYYSYLSKVNNNIFRQQWRNIEREITSLFIMYVL